MLLNQFSGPGGQNNAFVYNTKFNHTGEFVIAGGGTGQNDVRIFNYADGQLVSNVHGLTKSVFSIDVCKTKNTFVFGAADSHFRVLELKKRSDKGKKD